MGHDWKIDSGRSRLDMHVYVWCCKLCGCLQIKTGGLDAPSAYKPNSPDWNPFRKLDSEPPCDAAPDKTPMPVSESAPREARQTPSSTVAAGR